MKNKHKRNFLSHYKWYDYCFLLQAIEDWCEHASKMTHKHGTHLNHKQKAKTLKILSLLAKRMSEDGFSVDYCCLYPRVDLDMIHEKDNVLHFKQLPDEQTYDRVKRRLYKQQDRNQAYCLEYFCKLLQKHLFTLWD